MPEIPASRMISVGDEATSAGRRKKRKKKRGAGYTVSTYLLDENKEKDADVMAFHPCATSVRNARTEKGRDIQGERRNNVVRDNVARYIHENNAISWKI